MADTHFPDNPRESADFPLLTRNLRRLTLSEVLLLNPHEPDGAANVYAGFEVRGVADAVALRKAIIKFAQEWKHDG